MNLEFEEEGEITILTTESDTCQLSKADSGELGIVCSN